MLNSLAYLAGSSVPTITTIRAAVLESVKGAQVEMLGTIADVTPVAMAVIIAVLVVSFSIGLFIKLSGKAKA